MTTYAITRGRRIRALRPGWPRRYVGVRRCPEQAADRADFRRDLTVLVGLLAGLTAVVGLFLTAI